MLRTSCFVAVSSFQSPIVCPVPGRYRLSLMKSRWQIDRWRSHASTSLLELCIDKDRRIVLPASILEAVVPFQ